MPPERPLQFAIFLSRRILFKVLRSFHREVSGSFHSQGGQFAFAQWPDRAHSFEAAPQSHTYSLVTRPQSRALPLVSATRAHPRLPSGSLPAVSEVCDCRSLMSSHCDKTIPYPASLSARLQYKLQCPDLWSGLSLSCTNESGTGSTLRGDSWCLQLTAFPFVGTSQRLQVRLLCHRPCRADSASLISSKSIPESAALHPNNVYAFYVPMQR